jgi:hypothetical protein
VVYRLSMQDIRQLQADALALELRRAQQEFDSLDREHVCEGTKAIMRANLKRVTESARYKLNFLANQAITPNPNGLQCMSVGSRR